MKAARQKTPAKRKRAPAPAAPRVVVVGYRPLPGQAAALRKLMRTHVQRLRDEGLATARRSILMEAADGTVIEVFEWKSAAAIAAAHANAAVQKMWFEYEKVCEYVPAGELAEMGRLFSDFAPLAGDEAGGRTKKPAKRAGAGRG